MQIARRLIAMFVCTLALGCATGGERTRVSALPEGLWEVFVIDGREAYGIGPIVDFRRNAIYADVGCRAFAASFQMQAETLVVDDVVETRRSEPCRETRWDMTRVAAQSDRVIALLRQSQFTAYRVRSPGPAANYDLVLIGRRGQRLWLREVPPQVV